MRRCGACGYIHEGDNAPDKCPECGASIEKFEKLAENEVTLVEWSRYTNSLHM